MKIGFFKSVPIYVLLYKNRIKVSRLDSGKSIDRTSSKPFSNSRLLLGDFYVFEGFLLELLKDLLSEYNYIFPSLSMLIHQMELKEDGITNVERRALFDSARHTNAKEAYLCFDDEELSLKEVLKRIKNKEGVYSIKDSKI